jgi:hypothetical protein
LDGVGLAFCAAGPRRWVRAIGLDFLGAWLFRREIPR